MVAADERIDNAVKVVDAPEGEYLASFGVYHEIHCLVSNVSLFSQRDKPICVTGLRVR